MERALVMKQLAAENGDQAYGAVIVRSGGIVGQAPSRVVINEDPAAAYWAGIESLFHGPDIIERGAPQLRRC